MITTNVYYIAGFPVTDELYHYGVKGQSWGNRRFQNEDGSLTALGRQHYDVGAPLDPSVQNNPVGQGLSRAQAYAIAKRKSSTNVVSSKNNKAVKKSSNSRENVKAAQNALVTLGYGLEKYGADGKYGSETKAAINRFKRDMGLKEDGILDSETSILLQKTLSERLGTSQQIQGQNAESTEQENNQNSSNNTEEAAKEKKQKNRSKKQKGKQKVEEILNKLDSQTDATSEQATTSDTESTTKRLETAFSEMDEISAWLKDTDDVLEKGSKSERDVKSLQNALMALGYGLEKHGADGKFGSETQAALNSFKRDMGIKEDGVLDFETSRKLQGALEDHIARNRKTKTTTSKQSSDTKNTQNQPMTTKETQKTKSSSSKKEDELVQSPGLVLPSIGGSNSNQSSSKTTNKQTRSDEILKTLESSGKQIANQHKKVSEGISRASDKIGKAVSSGARKTGDALSSAAKNAGKAISNAADSVNKYADSKRKAADKRAKMYQDISDTASTIKSSAINVSKSVRDTANKIANQHNRLVSEISNLVNPKKKKTNNVSSFLSGAKSTISKGSKAVSRLFGG